MIRDICEMLGINCFTISAINILINDGGSEEKGGAASSLDFETMQALAKAFYSPPAVVILLDVEMALGYNEVVPREQFVGRLKLLKHLSELRPAICLAGLIDFIGGGRGDRLSSVPTFLLELFDYSLVKLTIPLREERQEILKQQIAYFLLESGRELSPLSSCRMAADLKIVSRLIGEDLPLIDRYSNILSLMTPGYVRDDLLDLCKLAVFPQLQLPQPSGIVDNAIAASTEAMGRISLSSVMTQHEPTPSTSLDLTCFRKAIDLLRPSDPLLTEFCTLERIDEAVGGYGEQLSELKQMILWHSTYQDTFKRMGASQSRGALLYGPSGCGKSLITRHLSGSYLYHVLFLKGYPLDFT
jgi:hypothetical protein